MPEKICVHQGIVLTICEFIRKSEEFLLTLRQGSQTRGPPDVSMRPAFFSKND